MKIDIERVNHPNDIIAPILDLMISRKFLSEDGNEYNELDLMSGDAIYNLLQDSILFYLHEVKWVDKQGEKIKSKFCKIPKGLKKTQTYLTELYKKQLLFKDKYKRVKTVMLQHAWNIILANEGLTIKERI